MTTQAIGINSAPVTEPIVSPESTECPNRATACKVDCAARDTWSNAACIGLSILSASTLPFSWSLGAMALGFVASYLSNGGSGVIFEKGESARSGDLLRLGGLTAIAYLFPQTAPWAAGAALVFYGNLAYRKSEHLFA